MYHKSYGILETLAPLHVGATAGEETGNLNLIFRDQFTQTAIIPGSSIRGRFRADMNNIDEKRTWYGHETIPGQEDGGTTEAKVKFEYASLVWLPVFCPGQPIVWVTSPLLLKRYKQITGISAKVPNPYTASPSLQARVVQGVNRNSKVLFFNLGFLEIEHLEELSSWIPPQADLKASQLVVVDDNDISMLHDMALYRQSRVKLLEGQKKGGYRKRSFFQCGSFTRG